MSYSAKDTVLWESVRGDALGGITEFKTQAHLSTLPDPDVLTVTDDTQMSLYTMSGIFALFEQNIISPHDSQIPPEKWDKVRRVFAAHYITYLNDPDNHAGRAPGVTVISALDGLERYWIRAERDSDITGIEGARPHSKGCGSVMRTGWIGLLKIPPTLMIDLAILSASVTHGHPTAQIMAALSPLIVRHPAPWVLPLSEHSILEWTLGYIAERYGLELENAEYEIFMRRLSDDNIDAYLAQDLASSDICQFFGEGWTADEAVSCALGALRTAHRADLSPRTLINRLILSSGDSDSIAMIGALYLARFVNNVPDFGYAERVEKRYKLELEALSQKISEFNRQILYFRKNV